MKYLKRFDKLNETSIVRNNQGKWWEEKFDTEAVSLIEGYINTRLTSFEEQLSKLETIEE